MCLWHFSCIYYGDHSLICLPKSGLTPMLAFQQRVKSGSTEKSQTLTQSRIVCFFVCHSRKYHDETSTTVLSTILLLKIKIQNIHSTLYIIFGLQYKKTKRFLHLYQTTMKCNSCLNVVIVFS